MYEGILWTGIMLALAETFFVAAIMVSKNIGVTMMLATFTVAMGYLLSIALYGESLNYFCLAGAICIIIGVYKIIF